LKVFGRFPFWKFILSFKFTFYYLIEKLFRNQLYLISLLIENIFINCPDDEISLFAEEKDRDKHIYDRFVFNINYYKDKKNLVLAPPKEQKINEYKTDKNPIFIHTYIIKHIKSKKKITNELCKKQIIWIYRFYEFFLKKPDKLQILKIITTQVITLLNPISIFIKERNTTPGKILSNPRYIIDVVEQKNPTFQKKNDDDDGLFTLNSKVAYLTYYNTDKFLEYSGTGENVPSSEIKIT
jgi:hypothetical protein